MAVLCTLGAAPVRAHDFWIEPAKFRAEVGAKIPLQLLVGEHFKGNGALYNPAHFERYVYVSHGTERPVPGIVGDDPAGSLALTQPGLYLIGYYSKKFDVTFDKLEEFERYLAIEGLERNLPLARKRAGIRGGIVEFYTRCAKSLVTTREANVDSLTGFDQVLGFPLELVAETNPYRQKDLRLRLLYRGRPLAGALVTAFNKAEPTVKLRAHTDEEGRVTLALARPGIWLVTSVHQIPLSWYARADWESFWASLTFERP